jgi:hypothetical protein
MFYCILTLVARAGTSRENFGWSLNNEEWLLVTRLPTEYRASYFIYLISGATRG